MINTLPAIYLIAVYGFETPVPLPNWISPFIAVCLTVYHVR